MGVVKAEGLYLADGILVAYVCSLEEPMSRPGVGVLG